MSYVHKVKIGKKMYYAIAPSYGGIAIFSAKDWNSHKDPQPQDATWYVQDIDPEAEGGVEATVKLLSSSGFFDG
jgi:hypothetical protein